MRMFEMSWRVLVLVLTVFSCTGCTVSALSIGDYSKSVDRYTKAVKENDTLYVAFQTREWKPGWFSAIKTNRLADGFAELDLKGKGTDAAASRYRQVSEGALPKEVEEKGESVPIRSALNDAISQELESFGVVSFSGNRQTNQAFSEASRSEVPTGEVVLYPVSSMGGFYFVTYDSTDRPQAPILIQDPSPLPSGKHWWGYPAMAVALPPAVLGDLFMILFLIASN